ncbi:MAG: hypothetical protein AAF927_09345 [Bacteroidota bacterium]
MHSFQPYLHFHKTDEFIYELQALIAIPDDWIYDNTVEVTTHSVEGEKLFFILLKEETGHAYNGSLEVTFTVESESNDKIIVEVVKLLGGSDHDVLGHFAAFLDDSSEGEMADRIVNGPGKKAVTSSTQIIRDPV